MFDSNKHDLEKVSADSNDGRSPEKVSGGEADVYYDATSDDKYGTTQRGLKSRHIQLIALGGCIGTVSRRFVRSVRFSMAESQYQSLSIVQD